MRCSICNKPLTNSESKWDDVINNFGNTCNECSSVAKDVINEMEFHDNYSEDAADYQWGSGTVHDPFNYNGDEEDIK